MPSELNSSDRAAASKTINIEEKNRWLCRVIEASESRKGTTHEITVEVLNDDGTPFLNKKEEATTFKRWVTKSENRFKEAFLQTFLPHILANGGSWEYEELLGRYCMGIFGEEDVPEEFGGGKRAKLVNFEAAPEDMLESIGVAPKKVAAAKPAAAKPATPAKPAAAAAVAKPAAKPAQAAKPATATATKPAATATATDDDAPFGE